MKTSFRNWTDWDRARMAVTEGTYLKGGGKHLTFHHYEGLPDRPAARVANHILGALDYSFTEEWGSSQGTGQRQEKNWTYDNQGRVDLLTIQNEWKVPTTDFSDPNSFPVVTPNASSDSGDVQYDPSYDTLGNLDKIVYSGGDPTPTSGGTTVSYTADYTPVYGQIAKLRLGPSPTTFGYDVRDLSVASNGLITASTDPNGLATSFTYDQLRRLTSIAPPNNELATRVIYPDLKTIRAITSPGAETVFQATNTEQVFAERRFDGLGRLLELRKALPDGALAVQITRYDPMGRVVFLSEWLNAAEWDSGAIAKQTWFGGAWAPNYWVEVPRTSPTGRPWGTVTFYGTPATAEPGNPLKATTDALGRVHRVERADGTSEDTVYCGPHKEVTVHGVRTGISGTTSDVKTRYYYDGLGRLALVDTQPFQSDAGTPEGADAAYDYDALGNLTKVNLVARLPVSPFNAWRSGTIADEQVRRFEYDALGKLRRSMIPERGETNPNDSAAWDYFDRYDSLGNLLAHRDPLAVKRGYFFRSTYDAAGRLTLAQRVQGTPASPSSVVADRLGGEGGIAATLPSSWVLGSIGGTTFTPAGSQDPKFWRVLSYSSATCVPSPPGETTGYLLHFGNIAGSCAYSGVAVPSGPYAIQRALTNVTRDDVVTFKFWRQVRDVATPKDVFSVWVVKGSGTSVANRKRVLQLDSRQASFARWQQSQSVRLGDLFTQSEWGEGTANDLYLYFVFEKTDTASTGLGAGVYVDEVFVGRRPTESLAEHTYDQDACQGPLDAGEACDADQLGANAYRNQLARVTSYEGGRVVSHRTNVYKGLNGRQSGEQLLVDWAGGGLFAEFVSQSTYDPAGRVASWTPAYIPGVNQPRLYTNAYDRALLVRAQWGSMLFLGSGAQDGITYNAAGAPQEIRFRNGTTTTILPDLMHRPTSYSVVGPFGSYWTSGDYAYDGAGNVGSIGTQRYSYDGHGRLRLADVLRQASSPSDPSLLHVTHSYDLYGNITGQDWASDVAAATSGAPSGFDFVGRSYASGGVNRNRVTDTPFVYDLNGNLIQMLGNSGGEAGALWDAQNRMAAYYQGYPATGGLVTERYLYEASGNRLVRYPEGGDGRPVISLRDASGQVDSEYAETPGDNTPRLSKDFIYGAGQLLVERTEVGTAPTVAMLSSWSTGASFGFSVSDPSPTSSYQVDIRTADGYQNTLNGVVPDAAGAFWIAEEEFQLDSVNQVRVRRESADVGAYSPALTITIDPTITSSSDNQMRVLAVDRKDDTITFHWRLGEVNEKDTQAYFEYVKEGETYVESVGELPAQVTPEGLVEVTEQSLSVPCGAFWGRQSSSGVPTSPSLIASMPGTGSSSTLEPNRPPCDDNPPPAPFYVFADAYHHRDHLGNLRVVTDGAGNKVSGHDYYPFGFELLPDPFTSAVGGSRRRFSGHERDEATGLDYLGARFSGSAISRFLSTDPAQSSAHPDQPQAWNRYSYVLNAPLSAVDPDGKNPLGFVDVLRNASAVASAAGSFMRGLFAGGQDHTGVNSIPAAPPEVRGGGVAFDAGQAAGEFIATHDTIVEASLTIDTSIGPAAVVGLSAVNGNDFYAFAGGGVSSASVAPASASFSVGVVGNYSGPGSFAGKFYSGTTTSPLGFTVAGDPQNPTGANALMVTATSDIGVATVTRTEYKSLTQPRKEER